MESKNIFDYLPEELDGKNGKVNLSEIKKSPLIGIYFSAHWCPPCRGFTPILSNFYKVVNKKNKEIEIIFVSFDREENSYKEYYDSMPWLSFPFKSEQKMEVAKDFGINGIPAFLVFDNKGNLIDQDARTIVQKSKGSGFNKESADKIIEGWNSKIKK